MLRKIKEPTCVGDKLHNECMDILLSDVDKRTSQYKEVISILNKLQAQYPNKRWIFDLLSGKMECRKLNALMRSKSEKAFQNKLVSYIKYLETGTRYGSIFRCFEIIEFRKLVIKD